MDGTPFSGVPMTVAIRLRREHLDAMIAHALEDAPVECCGLLAAKDGTVVTVHRATNAAASPYRFELDTKESMRLQRAMDDTGDTFAGIYHSHTGTEPVPSPTDVRMMERFFVPPFVHFVIGVADRENPVARAWYIENGDKTEQQYELID
jgi:[CysO sulfur-carrier protein]-S-L-cysteine hydrolase